MKKYSVIIPTYNEKDNIKLLVSEIDKALKNLDYEIIFVDDGSPDNCPQICDEWEKKMIE